jgi:hypothetical protein
MALHSDISHEISSFLKSTLRETYFSNLLQKRPAPGETSHLNIPCTKPNTIMGMTAMNQKTQTMPTAK